jgi:hypothetical protein
MSLAVARIASQVVSGVEVARAWSAALARNGGERARIARRASAYAGPQSMGSGQVAGGVKRSGQRYQEENYQRDEYGQRYRNGDGHSAAQQVRQRALKEPGRDEQDDQDDAADNEPSVSGN